MFSKRKNVYFIETDIERDDLTALLKEQDEKVQIRYMRYRSLDEYDTHRDMNEILGA